ncbi:ArsR/SmtB family transcription factor [Modestobacter lacusdianchii]
MPFTPGRPLAEAKADLFKALAHPARIRVLELLAEGEQTVGALAEATGLELSHLSQQVSVLRRAGIVDSRRVGNNVFCTLCDPQTAELLGVARRMLTVHLRQGQALLQALDGADDAVAVADAGRGTSTPAQA